MAEFPQPSGLPEAVDLAALGLGPDLITRIELLRKSHGNALYRIATDRGSFVLKCSSDPADAEVRAYRLLAELEVPILPVHGRAEHALLLEDLDASPTWRLATRDDVSRAEVGVAVAEWYLMFHRAGCGLAEDKAPDFLVREVDALSPAMILDMGDKLGMADGPVWHFAASHVEELKAAFRMFPETLNYNDFHWSNLALSREDSMRAIVFDYHLLGLGPAYCDIRNVLGSLEGEAKEAFRETYGDFDERVAVLDAPLSVLYALHVATQLPRLPRWAEGCAESVQSGEFERNLRVGLEAATQLRAGAQSPKN